MIDIIVQIEVYKKALKAQTCLSVATRYENELRSLESEYSILLAKITIEPEVCKT
jgi:hypothetical protein